MGATYKQTLNGVEPEMIKIISLEPLFTLVSTFSVGMIMLAIVSFYFGGGLFNSIKGKK